MNLSPLLWHVRIDRAQFETALPNLVVNARDAVGGTGEIVIGTRNVSLVDGDVADVSGGDFVMMSVRDNGPGIAPHVAAQVFDPFFTTKEVGKGSGLGLSQVQGFARGAGGHARVAPKSGPGATIEVYLPRCLETPVDQRKMIRQGNERISSPFRTSTARRRSTGASDGGSTPTSPPVTTSA